MSLPLPELTVGFLLLAALSGGSEIVEQTPAQALASGSCRDVLTAWRDRTPAARISCRRWGGSLQAWNT